MENRLAVTAMKVLRSYIDKFGETDGFHNLTSKSVDPKYWNRYILNVSLGTNEIIKRTGKDRSHISKSIKLLKDLQLLSEYSKWQEGKRKDTRLTALGVEIARMTSDGELFKKMIPIMSKTLREILSRSPESFYQSKESINRAFENSAIEPSSLSSYFTISTYKDALTAIQTMQEPWILSIVRTYWNIVSEFKLDNKRRLFLEAIIMNTIHDHLQEVSREISAFTSWIGEQPPLNLDHKKILIEFGPFCFWFKVSIMPDDLKGSNPAQD